MCDGNGCYVNDCECKVVSVLDFGFGGKTVAYVYGV